MADKFIVPKVITHEAYVDLLEQLQALQRDDSADYGYKARFEIVREQLVGVREQLEAAHRGMQELIIKNGRLNAACEAADRLLDDVYAKGEKHESDLLRVRTEVSAALATSSPAKERQ